MAPSQPPLAPPREAPPASNEVGFVPSSLHSLADGARDPAYLEIFMSQMSQGIEESSIIHAIAGSFELSEAEVINRLIDEARAKHSKGSPEAVFVLED